jgi:hypothetical protein
VSARTDGEDALAFARAALCLAGLHHPGVEAQCAEARGWIASAARLARIKLRPVSDVIPLLPEECARGWDDCLAYASTQLAKAAAALPNEGTLRAIDEAQRAIDYAVRVRARTSAVQPPGGRHAS